MNDLLRTTLDELALLAADLSRQVTRTDGLVTPLVVAQAVVTADRLRTHLRRLADRLSAATPKEGAGR